MMFYIDNGTRIKDGVVIANETREGALDDPAVEEVVQSIAQRIPIYIITYNKKSRQIFVPKDRQAEIAGLLQGDS